MKIKSLVIFCFCLLLSLMVADVFAATPSINRADVIAKELDCLSRNMNQEEFVDWGHVCYVDDGEEKDSDTMADALTSVNNFEVAPIVVTSEPADDDYDYRVEDYDSDYVYESSDTIAPQDTIYKQNKIYKSDAVRKDPSNKEFWSYDNLFARENPLTKLEVGFEFNRTIYEEPKLMKDQGNMFGFNLGYTYRTSNNAHISSIKDMFSDQSKVNMFKFEFDMSQGEMDYKSNGTGSMENVENRKLEVRGLMGYDIPVKMSSIVTPYVGFGYRYLNDDSGGRLTNTGAVGYERENKCYYMPLGVQTDTLLAKNWRFGMSLEYDLFLDGQQISHMEDTGMFYGSDGHLHSSDPLKHEQYNGYGLKANFQVVKENQSFDIFLRPYFNYWEKDDSDLTQLSSDGGSTVWYYDEALNYPVWYYEPQNKTWEYGVKMGIQF